MSEQETSGADVANNKSPVLMVEQEQSAASRHKPFRPTELQDEQPELLHKRSKAPAVPSVADQLIIKPEETVQVQEDKNKSEWKEQERGSSEKLKHKHLLSKKSRSKKHDSTTPPETETIALAALGVRDKPIPADVKSISSAVSEPIKPVSKQDEDTIAELRTPKSTRKISEWSDDEEAGGLPRSDSRASRVSRAVRQLFCCGTAYSPPSEDNISTDRYPSGI